MKIAVCVKVIKGEINPFDECALETALTLSDDVTVFSMSPPSAKDALLRLTRLGASVKMLCDGAFAGADTLATAYTLSCALKKEKFDLILCGRQSVDGDTAQVGPCLAAKLSLPLITNVLEIKAVQAEISCRTRLAEIESATLPCIITVERINTLRFPGILSSTTEIEMLSAADIGADLSKTGLCGSPTRVLQTFENTAGRRRCKFAEASELEEIIQKSLHKEAELHKKNESKEKVPLAWAIGEQVISAAQSIAQEVVVMQDADPYSLANLAKEKNPGVVLWNADLRGRRNAPIFAALLETGLCADCTSLETDGETLYMYRPAAGGSITAKIKSLTRPQTATVRTESGSLDFAVSAGRGAIGFVDKIQDYAKAHNAVFCASRALVDSGAVPYECQVGLTGKAIAPRVYLAIGISGTVQHMCAVENTGTIIAVNSDKNARIFDFADYGILCHCRDILG